MADSDTPSKRGTDRLTPREIDGWIARHRSGKLRKGAKADRNKLSDGGGMYLVLTPAGTPVWRMKFRAASRDPARAGDITEQVFPIGVYPEVTLAEARERRADARKHLEAGRNPVQAKSVKKAAAMEASSNTFESVAREWLKKRRKDWSAIHYEKSTQAFEKNVLPFLGRLPVAEITPKMITDVIETIVERGAVDTASKVLQHVGGMFRLAQAKGICDYKENPATAAREMLPRKRQHKPRPAMLKWPELGGILRGAEAAHLTPSVRIAHRLLSFSAARISNVVQAEWKEFDLDAEPPLWVISRKKMKVQDRAHDHKVILGPTIAADLREWKRLSGGKGYVFPSPAGGKHITRESLEKAYRVTLGLADKHTPHGWRSALSTLARDKGDEVDKDGKVISAAFERDVVELALDHIHDNDVVRAYDRGERLKQRIRLMQWWDSHLASAERGADVVPMRAKA